MNKKKRNFYKETTVTHNAEGIVTTIEQRAVSKDAEPPFVKLYLDCLLQFKQVSPSLNPILFELLKYMSYASPLELDPSGGQIIFLNAELKRRIAQTTGKTVKRLEQALTDFVKAKIFRRIAPGTYQVNAELFGKGDWKEISNIRAIFDFKNGRIRAKISKEKTIEDFDIFEVVEMEGAGI